MVLWGPYSMAENKWVPGVITLLAEVISPHLYLDPGPTMKPMKPTCVSSSYIPHP